MHTIQSNDIIVNIMNRMLLIRSNETALRYLSINRGQKPSIQKLIQKLLKNHK